MTIILKDIEDVKAVIKDTIKTEIDISNRDI